MNKLYFILISVFLCTITISAQNEVRKKTRKQTRQQQHTKSDANINGHVICCDEHIPFATISVKGTTIGTTTDETGHYHLINLPEGKLTLVVQSLGYKPVEKEVTAVKGKTITVKFELQEDVLGLEEVVVTGDRNETNRKEASTIVNTITHKIFSTTQSVTLSEGLNFCPGLRTETDCQNCGFTQVRMNGMEGPYSQILINSRPIFSGLAGVYGLELIPANMIERVEVIRGGGSALYGSNAIAGTINLILKDPIKDTYEFGVNSGLTGVGFSDPASDYSVNFNSSVVSSDNKTGMSMYGFYRHRNPFDANDDEFSEIALLKNVTIGSRLYHRFGKRSKVALDFFHIKEDRRGGDKFDYPPHEANIAEAVNHGITTGAVTYDQFFRDIDMLSVYASGQRVNRDSYYGANKSLKDYGNTKDFTFTVGTQYKAQFANSNLIAGIENVGSSLIDKKLGYADFENATIINDSIIDIPHTDNVTIADQTINTTGIFAQYEIDWNKLNASVGARFDHYQVRDKENPDSDNSGNVLSPRVTLKYDIKYWLQARLSFSQGYRAPQIFDEDLHIETSGSRKVIHKNSPDLKQETSNSFMGSVDFNKQLGKTYLGILIEGFYTKLKNPFVMEYGTPDEDGTVIYTRVNAEDGARVTGMNIELNFIPTNNITLKAGYTIQSSKYEAPQEFDETSFFRTPSNYGYLTFDWKLLKNLAVSSTGNYTGKMLVPYFGPEIPNPEDGELRTSGNFFDIGLKARYNIKVNGATLQLFGGIKNMFNSYQSDFDKGIDRDPGYIYGPGEPRSIYFGIKIGNIVDL
jgi:outer membrane receptor for ferrienterochelin and colicins